MANPSSLQAAIAAHHARAVNAEATMNGTQMKPAFCMNNVSPVVVA